MTADASYRGKRHIATGAVVLVGFLVLAVLTHRERARAIAADGRWLPDPWGEGLLRWQSNSGVWSDWVSGVVQVAAEPCHQCGGREIAWRHNRMLFWLCVRLFSPAAFYVPRKPSCARCHAERWEVVRAEASKDRPAMTDERC